MTCPRCTGLLVEDFDLDLREHWRCANCGCRPNHAAAAPAPRHGQIRLRPRQIDRPAALAALRACGAALGRAPTKLAFEAHCKHAGLPWRAYHLTGSPYRPEWRGWPDILREAGFEPTLTQINVSRGKLRLTEQERLRA